MRANGTTKACEQCGKPFYVPASETHIKRCSRECYWASRWGAKRRREQTCTICGEAFMAYPSDGKVVCGRECDNVRKSLTMRGEQSILWRGGRISPYNGEWKQRRREALERDGHLCVLCGSDDRVQVHHIKPARYGGTHDIDNLISLCRSCHSKEEMKVNAAYRATLLNGSQAVTS